ncbi:hypothetical protein MTO96_039601 [Rhipicephalus appendiculatus]
MNSTTLRTSVALIEIRLQAEEVSGRQPLPVSERGGTEHPPVRSLHPWITEITSSISALLQRAHIGKPSDFGSYAFYKKFP